MTDLYKYRCYCTADSKYVYEWRDSTQPAPSVCVENTAHAINTAQTTIVERSLEKALADADGAEYARPKFAQPGWSYQMRSIQLKTSQLDSLRSSKFSPQTRLGTSWGDVAIRFYGVVGGVVTELTTQTELDSLCTITEVDFEPPYDIEIIGGTVGVLQELTTDLWLHVVGAPGIPEAYGGSKHFVSDINLNYIEAKGEIKSDGRTTKRLTYDAVNHTSVMRTIFQHQTGQKVDFQILFELFKP